MASSWGSSWLSSWLNSWGALAAPPQSLTATALDDRNDFFGHAVISAGTNTLHPTGFANVNLFGIPAVTRVKVKGGGSGGGGSGGAVKGQKYGNQVTLDEDGLVFGIGVSASVAKSVTSRAVLYSDSASLPAAKITQSDSHTSVAVGTNVYILQVPQFLTTGTKVWPALHSDGNFAWFLQTGTSRFNDDNFVDGPSDPFGTSTLSANKAPIFALMMEATTLETAPTGYQNTSLFGGPTVTVVSGTQGLAPAALANENGFGTAVISVASVTLAASAVDDGDAFGSPTVSVASFTLSATEFDDSSDAFGSPTVTQTPHPVEHSIRHYDLSGTIINIYGLRGENDNAKTGDSIFGGNITLNGQ